jgi:hypothetical protein
MPKALSMSSSLKPTVVYNTLNPLPVGMDNPDLLNTDLMLGQER